MMGPCFLSYVCGGFNRRLSLRPCIHRVNFRHISISPFEEKMLYVCGGVNDFNKTYSTSAAPLLVRNRSYVCGAVARNLWNTFISQLKKHRISEVNLREVLVAPVPFVVVCFVMASDVAMCLKSKENQWILHVCDFLVRVFVSSVVRSIIVWGLLCSEIGLVVSNERRDHSDEL